MTEEDQDVVSVYYGSPDLNSAEFAASFTGTFTTLPDKIVSSNNFIIIVFDTDNTNIGGGTRRLRASWRVGECASLRVGECASWRVGQCASLRVGECASWIFCYYICSLPSF